jgi:hypothetical protein
MKNIPPFLVYSLAIIISTFIASGAWVKSHQPQSDTINVTGLATKDFSSDLIVWKCSYTRKSSAIKEAYTSLKKDAEIVRGYLRKKGVNEKEIVFSAVSIEKEFRTEMRGTVRDQIFDGNRLIQQVTIESKEVSKIEQVSREVTELIDMDIELSSLPPVYLYTKLSELKIELIAKATADGKLRAEQIASNAGTKLGDLKNANLGVFQITGQNSSEEYSYGGTFNTSSRNKTASITARLEFKSN